MACVIAPTDVDAFMKYCDEENLECTIVADVTDTNRLIMTWRGETIVDISRDFLKYKWSESTTRSCSDSSY